MRQGSTQNTSLCGSRVNYSLENGGGRAARGKSRATKYRGEEKRSAHAPDEIIHTRGDERQRKREFVASRRIHRAMKESVCAVRAWHTASLVSISHAAVRRTRV